MPVRPFGEQKAQLRTDEQAGANTAIAEAKAYRALDPADPPSTSYAGSESPFEGRGYAAELGTIGGRVKQTAQVRTDEQAGTPSTGAQRGYTNL
jgi:hypothetical protein